MLENINVIVGSVLPYANRPSLLPELTWKILDRWKSFQYTEMYRCMCAYSHSLLCWMDLFTRTY